MKKSIVMLAAAASLFLFPSCRKVTGEGPLQTEVRTITGFTGVSSGICGRINYKIEPECKVEIIAQQNILDVLETVKMNNHLLVKVKDGVHLTTNEDIVVNISAPTADYLQLNSSGHLAVSGNIVSSNLTLGISGSGSIFIPMLTIANTIDAGINGSGNISVQAGSVKEETLRISGSGKLNLDKVIAEKATATISGSGNMYVNLSQKLNATISGSGSVFYRGTPLVSTHISGSGTVMPF